MMTEYIPGYDPKDALFRALQGQFKGETDRDHWSAKVSIAEDHEIIFEKEVFNQNDLIKICDECINRIFDERKESTSEVFISYHEEWTACPFSPEEMFEKYETWERQRIAREEHERAKEEAKQKRFEAWKEAVQWARDNGARIRPGRCSRKTMICRVHEAGLVDKWNEKWSDFMISYKELEWYGLTSDKRR